MQSLTCLLLEGYLNSGISKRPSVANWLQGLLAPGTTFLVFLDVAMRKLRCGVM